MKIVVGLGNPGEKYKNTRHNAGFLVIDKLVDNLPNRPNHPESSKWTTESNSEIIKTQIATQSVLLLKPLTFMNLSGKEIKKAMIKNNISPEDLIVVYDDIDIPFGEIRVRQGGGSAGHNGINSIVEEVGSDNFIRVRIGINPTRSVSLEPTPHNLLPIADFVLEDFTPEEKEKLEKIMEDTATKIYQIIKFGYDQYISKYNI